jgi:hypothetical protein
MGTPTTSACWPRGASTSSWAAPYGCNCRLCRASSRRRSGPRRSTTTTCSGCASPRVRCAPRAGSSSTPRRAWPSRVSTGARASTSAWGGRLPSRGTSTSGPCCGIRTSTSPTTSPPRRTRGTSPSGCRLPSIPRRHRGPAAARWWPSASATTKTATTTACPTSSTSASTWWKTTTASRTKTAAPTSTTTTTACPTPKTDARARPRRPTASRTKTAAPTRPPRRRRPSPWRATRFGCVSGCTSATTGCRCPRCSCP